MFPPKPCPGRPVWTRPLNSRWKTARCGNAWPTPGPNWACRAGGLLQPHFLARSRRGVDGVENFLGFQRLLERHERLFAVEHTTNEVMNPILTIWNFGRIQMDGFKAIGAVPQEADRVE